MKAKKIINSTTSFADLLKHSRFDDCQVIKKFAPHSYSQTVLLKKNGKKIIRKFSDYRNRHKITNQAHWFKGMKSCRVFPQVYDSFYDSQISYVDMEYFTDAVSFFDYIHTEDTSKVIGLFVNILDFVHNNIHSKSPAVYSYQDANRYMNEKIKAKVKECEQILPENAVFFSAKKLIINGREYRNLNTLLDLISKDQKAMDCISLTRPGVIHGDLTIENILISPKSFHIIDPNDENYLLTPLVDYAKLMQSLDSGYEFLDQAQLTKAKDNIINYSVVISKQYIKLRQTLIEEVEKLFSGPESEALYFHQCAHFARLLPYKAYTNPNTILVFFSELIKKLNHFYDRLQSF